MLPQSITEWLPNLINGCTVGAGHFNQLEIPDQANAMIESFLRHYVCRRKGVIPAQEPAAADRPSTGLPYCLLRRGPLAGRLSKKLAPITGWAQAA